MRIAYIGLKGLPGSFSGVETHVHELGTRLVKRGHEVVAYVRPQYTPRSIKEDEGIHLLHLPTIATKHLDATVHSLCSAVHAAFQDYDIVHFHTIGPACFSPIIRLSSRAKVVATIHRFDYLSGKWGFFARTCLRLAEQITLRTPDATTVVAPFLKHYYAERGHGVFHITNGVTIPAQTIDCTKIRELGLSPNQYILFLGRLTPEKRPEWLIRAFQSLQSSGLALVIAGGSSATDKYVQQLKSSALPNRDKILFTGPVYDKMKDELLAHARLFILPSALEGLPITLLEAMSHGRPCLVSDIPPHVGVIRDDENGFLFHASDFDHFCERLRDVSCADESRLNAVGIAAKATVVSDYNWERIVDETESLYQRLIKTSPHYSGPSSNSTLPKRDTETV